MNSIFCPLCMQSLVMSNTTNPAIVAFNERQLKKFQTDHDHPNIVLKLTQTEPNVLLSTKSLKNTCILQQVMSPDERREESELR